MEEEVKIEEEVKVECEEGCECEKEVVEEEVGTELTGGETVVQEEVVA